MEAESGGAVEKGDGTMSDDVRVFGDTSEQYVEAYKGRVCAPYGDISLTPHEARILGGLLIEASDYAEGLRSGQAGTTGSSPEDATDPPPMLRPPPDAEGAGR